MTGTGSLVLSTLEFGVLWDGERLPDPHAALTLPPLGRTEAERATLTEKAWASLADRGLARGRRAVPELADRLAILAHPEVCVDILVRSDRETSALAAARGEQAMLAVIDGDTVFLVETRDTALAEAAVSVAGDVPAGFGEPVSLPTEILDAAAAAPGGFADELAVRGVPGADARVLAAMCEGIATRGRFGAESTRSGRPAVRADRVVAFHDTPRGRYLNLARRDVHGRTWTTIGPADNLRLAGCVWDLLDEV
ncbi:ESX secretion-associated protein EspG [Gandjariella thermophila]|uniref:ESX secretion-associated protein EspG n=1 Tax=Gandjariella thermophila TaxID=1931992 RepID=A0A4D4J989_9PSEU|nr:ESX secretion-associated protein EspG [Gandjariella thermophila]GDY32114.1 ESX secretion-associated protein EspG [Gandjariella thermophila]